MQYDINCLERETPAFILLDLWQSNSVDLEENTRKYEGCR